MRAMIVAEDKGTDLVPVTTPLVSTVVITSPVALIAVMNVFQDDGRDVRRAEEKSVSRIGLHVYYQRPVLDLRSSVLRAQRSETFSDVTEVIVNSASSFLLIF